MHCEDNRKAGNSNMQAGNLLLHPVVEATMMKQKKVGGGGGLALGEAAASGMGTTSRSPRSERQAEVVAVHWGGRSLACQSIFPLL